jgi:23S rRNA (adenine2503-C2)-methyltransferase
MGLHLRDHTPESLAASWPGLGLPLARRVVNRLVFEDRDDLVGVRGLSRAWAAALQETGRTTRLRVIDRRKSSVDPFMKYLFAAPEDGRTFETVRIPLDKPRYSVCVSSQAGCALACSFCETGRQGLFRNLEPWEMVEQVLTVRREARDRPVTGAVFQGQGEPLHNYDNVMRAAALLRHPCGPRIGSDRITISTVGLVPQIRRYTDEGHPYRLILSLSSAFSEKRAALVPITRTWGVPELAAAMRRHAEARGEAVNLAWVLISGWNTGEDEARELGRLFAGMKVRLSIVDVNDAAGTYRRASDEERGRFFSALSRAGIGFVRRYSGGPDIHAACGMLASAARGGEAVPTPGEAS